MKERVCVCDDCFGLRRVCRCCLSVSQGHVWVCVCLYVCQGACVRKCRLCCMYLLCSRLCCMCPLGSPVLASAPNNAITSPQLPATALLPHCPHQIVQFCSGGAFTATYYLLYFKNIRLVESAVPASPSSLRPPPSVPHLPAHVFCQYLPCLPCLFLSLSAPLVSTGPLTLNLALPPRTTHLIQPLSILYFPSPRPPFSRPSLQPSRPPRPALHRAFARVCERLSNVRGRE